MPETYIFVFGLAVTIVVGSGLVTMIIAKNRSIEAEDHSEGPETAR